MGINQTIRIAAVGDIHDQWGEADAIALQHLAPDLVLFVGDFGNEAVNVVAQIAALDLPKAAIFGNHDAWYTATDWGRKKCPYDPTQEDWVQRQMHLLGEAEVGYRHLDFPALGLSVVGGKPFSWGGPSWKHGKFYRDRYGIANMEESILRMQQVVDATAHDTLIFLGHCGPAGLGTEMESICGRDWKNSGGDYGDPDFAAAIDYARQQGKQVPLVTFGHMHHTLRHRKDRLRDRVVLQTVTTHVNAACVPRHRTTDQGRECHFSLITLHSGRVESVSGMWITPDGTITAAEPLFSRPESLVSR
ncbi:TIGR04168 family protein [filamentous cyanobacterium CCP5]|nr:TIGR04168 family protein [filamentous cyanobacterium CCP5]